MKDTETKQLRADLAAITERLAAVEADFAASPHGQRVNAERERETRRAKLRAVCTIADPVAVRDALLNLRGSEPRECLAMMSGDLAVDALALIADDTERERLLASAPMGLADRVRVRFVRVPRYVRLRGRGNGRKRSYHLVDPSVTARLVALGLEVDVIAYPPTISLPSLYPDVFSDRLERSLLYTEDQWTAIVEVVPSFADEVSVSFLSDVESEAALLVEWSTTPMAHRRPLPRR